jgi:hypothetical protein
MKSVRYVEKSRLSTSREAEYRQGFAVFDLEADSRECWDNRFPHVVALSYTLNFRNCGLFAVFDPRNSKLVFPLLMKLLASGPLSEQEASNEEGDKVGYRRCQEAFGPTELSEQTDSKSSKCYGPNIQRYLT